jgi:branched-chain amino acid transport system substrate-binding protein
MILFEAIARAADKGTIKKGGITQKIAKTDRETLIGKVKFNEHGDNENFTHRIGQHQNGKIVIVWPADSANGQMSYPGVPW